MAKIFKEPRMLVCKVRICDGTVFARGLCAAHLRRLYKTGSVSPRTPIKQRLGSKVSKTPEYRAWIHMHDRCYNPNHRNYRHYGERGISVCKRWHKSENFMSDMGPKPSPIHSLDRINNNKNYSPSNCRWATHRQQRANQNNHKRSVVTPKEVSIIIQLGTRYTHREIANIVGRNHLTVGRVLRNSKGDSSGKK